MVTNLDQVLNNKVKCFLVLLKIKPKKLQLIQKKQLKEMAMKSILRKIIKKTLLNSLNHQNNKIMFLMNPPYKMTNR